MSDTELIIQQLINGLARGSRIAIIALGYTMVYGIIQLINFAHGDVFMLGCYFALTAVAITGININTGIYLIPALIAIMILTAAFTGFINLQIYKIAYKPVIKSSRLAPLVAAIGTSFILQTIGLFWGTMPLEVMGHPAQPKMFPELIPYGNILEKIGISTQIEFFYKDFIVIATSIPLMIGLNIFIKKTKTGKAMRACASSHSVSELMGIDVDRIIRITFITGGALAGFGALITCLHTNQIDFQMGYTAGIYAFTAAVVGGIGNIKGTMIGGYLIGIISSLSDGYFFGSEWTPAVLFTVLILILIFKPSGIFGAKTQVKV